MPPTRLIPTRRLALLAAACVLATSLVEGRVSLEPTGRLSIDGKPFFPLTLCDAYPISNLDDAVALGFNSVELPVSQATPEMLNRAHELGLKVIVWLGGKGLFSPDRLAKVVEGMASHPALLAWYILDEPIQSKVSAAAFTEDLNIVRAADPHHPVMSVFGQLDEGRTHCRAVDIVGVNPYPIYHGEVPGGKVTEIEIDLASATRCGHRTGSRLAVIQAFGASAAWDRVPTAEELRVMTYLALAGGADGLVFYTLRHDGNKLKSLGNDLPLRVAMANLNAELKRLVPRLTTATVTTSTRGQVRLSRFASGADQFLILINASHEPVRPTIATPATASGRLDDFLTGRRLPLTALGDIALDGYGVRVFRLASTTVAAGQLRLGGSCGSETPNLALTGTVSASSYTKDPKTGGPALRYGPAKANDANASTQWASTSRYRLPVSFTVKLDRPARLNRLAITLPPAAFYDRWKEYSVAFGGHKAPKDGLTFTRPPTAARREIRFSPVFTDSVTVTIHSTYTRTSYVGCAEIELYADPEAPAEKPRPNGR